MRALLLLVALLLPAATEAQVGSTTDILRGRVTNPAGDPVSGARVEARSLETGIQRTAVTGDDGRYTLVFPDGGGRYQLRVSYLGMAPAVLGVAREADEDVLVANVRLQPEAVALEGVEVRAQRNTLPPGRGDAGTQQRSLSGELQSRLPLESDDPAALATLSPGVVAVDGSDSLGVAGGFSVAGQRSSLNQVTLDGSSFSSLLSGGSLGGSSLGLPQEGIRGTSVITSTYDVARGRFAGGQVAMTTRGGTSTLRGSFSYQLRDDRLQGSTGRTSWTDGYTQHRVSGGIGGPIVRDRLHYNLSFVTERRADELFALAPKRPSGFAELGVHPDSVSRFLRILEERYGISTAGRTGAFERGRDALTVLGRVDYTLTPAHTLALRAHGTLSAQDSALIRSLETRESGGEAAHDGGGLFATLTSRFGTGWVNELRASLTGSGQEMLPYAELPEGRVRIASTLDDGTRGIATVGFGGDPFLPRATRERTVELSDELSWLLGDTHRLKLGGFFNHSAFSQEAAAHRFGSFTFNSLADFEEGRAASFTRALSPRETEGSGWNAALYLGDSWRPRPRLQLTYGVRLEGSGFGEAPGYNAAADSAFGLRTDRAPAEVHLSPRVGFSLRLNRPGEPLRLLRGGAGEFRGRTPYSLYAGVLDASGAQGGEALLSCAGVGRVPTPDFQGFLADPTSLPSTCADGSAGRPSTGGRRNVTAFSEDFAAPRSWRASLGFQQRVFRGITGSVDVSWARGVSLFGVEDVNLRPDPVFTLSTEGGRPVFAAPSAIDPRTGEVSLFASRVDPRFAHAFRVHSGLESDTRLLTLSANGIVPRFRLSFESAYTYSVSRDQSSFSFGGAQQGFSTTVTRGNPNGPEWAPSDMDRRHTLSAIVGKSFEEWGELSLIARASSGAPFTPRVGGDVNGDGARNDAAFVFDPAAAPDPVVAAGMERLLATLPGSVRECLEEQKGEVAERNSCRGDWSHSLNLRASVRPRIGPMGRRLAMSADFLNLGAGLDLLLHGSGGLRGWGQQGFGVDPVLLYPGGFDPESRQFRYEVNEAFGRTRAERFTRGSPFGVQLSARVTVGPESRQGPLGGFAGLGLGGMGEGGAVRIARGAGAGGSGRMRMEVGEAGEGRSFGPEQILDRMLPEPIGAILALRDTLALTPEQAAELEAVRDSLKAKNGPIRQEVAKVFTGGRGEVNPGELFQRVGPRVNEGRRNVQAALDQAKAILTPEQWNRVPEVLRNAVARGRFEGRRPPD
jgi:hypothetical protein